MVQTSQALRDGSRLGLLDGTTRFVLCLVLTPLACGGPTVPANDRPKAVAVYPMEDAGTEDARAGDTGALRRDRDVSLAPPSPTASVPAPRLIDIGADPSHVQECAPATHFTPLAALFAKPERGKVLVRGRVWLSATLQCMGIPQYCFAHPLLALSAPKDQGPPQKDIDLSGNLTANTPLMCTSGPAPGAPPGGPRGAMRCPIPLEGIEYGITGTLTDSGNAGDSAWTIEVESLCQFRSAP